MPLRRNIEVCGKPTQYNLQTCEYDWKCLPDTHFNLERAPRRRVLPVKNCLRIEEDHSCVPSPSLTPVLPLSRRTELAIAPMPSTPAQQHAIVSEPHCTIIPWSHEELCKMVSLNYYEAQRLYLRKRG